MASDPTSPPAGVPTEPLDRLYHGDLERFTPERNKLEKRLRADGERKAAGWVKGLRKPTRAAWIVNRLSQRRRADVARLLEGGEELRALQEWLLEGTADSDRLRKAARAEQRTIDRLMGAATEIGAEHGAGSAVLDRVGETLQAASVDPEVADALRLGRLTREQRASSLGLVESAGPPPKQGRKRPRAADKPAARRARAAAAKERKAAEGKVSSAERKVARERTALERARAQAGERESRLREAARELDAARRALKRIR